MALKLTAVEMYTCSVTGSDEKGECLANNTVRRGVFDVSLHNFKLLSEKDKEDLVCKILFQ